MDHEVYTVFRGASWEIKILDGWKGIRSPDDNVDVYVTLDDGKRFVGSFFTLENLQSLFEKNKRTGENKDGLYFYSTDMILVERLTPEVIAMTVHDLIEHGQIDSAFTRIE